MPSGERRSVADQFDRVFTQPRPIPAGRPGPCSSAAAPEADVGRCCSNLALHV